jgi:hypothetical protein
MDPEHVASEDEAEAMAAAMGFSTFGTQGPSKKRKFNPKIDAFVEGQDLSSLDKGGKHGQGSGGNQIPLGKPRVFGVKKETEVMRNEEEISLEEGGDEDEGPRYVDDEDEAPQYLDTSRPPPAAAGRQRVRNEDEILLDEEDEDAGPAYLNPNLPAPDAASRGAQERIDAILAASSSAQPAEPPALVVKEKKKKQVTKNTPVGGVGAFMAALRAPVVIPPAPGVPSSQPASSLQTPFPSSLPQRPPPPSPSIAGSVTGSMGTQRGARGQRNELWYVDYYDPSFNENPWKALEREGGLPEVGSWLQRPRREGQGQMA